MRLTAENKEKIRARIRQGAADLFRRRGVEAVTLDDVMQSASLTRGAFYAHYGSKSALLADVMRHEHPLLSLLRQRDGAGPEELWSQMRAIFADYLAPAHHARVFAGCSFAALGGAAARADDASRDGYEAAWREMRKEMSRGQARVDDALLQAALTLAVGSVSAAAALQDSAARAALLQDGLAGVDRLLACARG